MNEIEIYDEDGELVAWVTEDGVIGGPDAGDIFPPSEATDISVTVTAISGDVKIYYDGTSWNKVAYWKEGDTPEFRDFNGVAIINMELPFKLQFKTEDGTESVEYKVAGKGKFLFHENGSWEKIK